MPVLPSTSISEHFETLTDPRRDHLKEHALLDIGDAQRRRLRQRRISRTRGANARLNVLIPIGELAYVRVQLLNLLAGGGR